MAKKKREQKYKTFKEWYDSQDVRRVTCFIDSIPETEKNGIIVPGIFVFSLDNAEELFKDIPTFPPKRNLFVTNFNKVKGKKELTREVRKFFFGTRIIWEDNTKPKLRKRRKTLAK